MSFERTTSPPNPSHTEAFLYAPTSTEGNAGTNGDESLPWSLQNAGAVVNSEKREAEAFERGLQEGEARGKANYERQLAAINGAVSRAIEAFKVEREAYFSRAEPEVVQLALAIARKILHREAQMDPLLLAGMVHVALEKLDSGTRVRLHAHPADVRFWNEYFSQAGAFQPAPELIGDSTLQRGECALETEIGSTQVSLETQLKEIEQGFFDLLEQRPRVR